MKLKLFYITALACLFLKPVQAQFLEANDADLIGYYKLKSLKIGFDIDLNKDGKKSNELFDEYTDCQKDLTLELLADHTATMCVACNVENCKEKEQEQYKWEVQKKSIEERTSVNGKTVKKMVDKTFLVLFSTKNNEPIPFEILMTSTFNIKLKGMVGGLTDTTESGVFNFKKTKKEKK
jgi:hypothetical protein